MQAYAGQPVIEVQQDQHIEAALMRLQEDLQQHLQQQPQEQHYAPAAPAAQDDTGLAMAAGSDAMPPSPHAELYDAVAAAVSRPASIASARSSADDEWHLVSPHGSVKAPSSSRASFDDEAAAAAGSDSETGAHSPKDELAASILGHPVLMSSFLAASREELDTSAATNSTNELTGAGGMDVKVAAAEDGASVTESSSAAASKVAAVPAEAFEASAVLVGAAPVGPDEMVTGWGLLTGELAGLGNKAALSIEGFKDWIMESLAALVEGGRSSHAACMSGYQSTLRNLQLAAKQGGLTAAAVNVAGDWRVVLSSAAAVVCLALWLRSRKEAAALRLMLRRRDHELSKLVMRVVSLQELINQGHHLPISRYSSTTSYSHQGLGVAAGVI